MVQQAGTFQLAELLIADAIGNDSQCLASESFQAGCSIVIRAGERFVFTNKNLISRVSRVVCQLLGGKDLAHAGPPLLPNGNLSTTEAVEVLA